MEQNTEFKSRDELEHAYHLGRLRRGVHYRVRGSKHLYRLCVVRKGIAEVMNGTR